MTLPLVLLHGFSGAPDAWDTVRGGIGDAIPVVAPILVGHGAAPHADVKDFVGEVDRLAAELRASGARCHLAGYSLGGRVAIGLLCRHPDLFETATLISAQPGLAVDADREARRGADARVVALLEERGIEAFVDAWEKIPLFATQGALPAEILARQRKSRLSRDPAGLALSLRVTGLAEMPSYWGELGDVRTPTTILVGAQDVKFESIGRRMHEAMPESRFEVIPGAGHNVVLEAPDAVVRTLRAQVARS